MQTYGGSGVDILFLLSCFATEILKSRCVMREEVAALYKVGYSQVPDQGDEKNPTIPPLDGKM